MGTLLQNGDQFIESSELADNSYGRNGYQGPSSDVGTRGVPTKTGFLPEVADTVPVSDWQTRTLDASPIATAKGTQRQNSAAGIPSIADVAPKRPSSVRRGG
jgi:hypothetical protein